MRISRDKVDICRARKKKSVAELAATYGVSRARMNAILNQREVSVVSAGRLADALECDVTEILED
jgi:DNA-binding Xre family transcriptional regulator|nr:helix-turn-helix transcriptional regulator [uncultured Acetatifactor sp.]